MAELSREQALLEGERQGLLSPIEQQQVNELRDMGGFPAPLGLPPSARRVAPAAMVAAAPAETPGQAAPAVPGPSLAVERAPLGESLAAGQQRAEEAARRLGRAFVSPGQPTSTIEQAKALFGLLPALTPAVSGGEVVGGTMARARGATPEEVATAEQRGGLVGGLVPLAGPTVLRTGARLLSPGLRGLIRAGEQQIQAGTANLATGIGQAGQLAEREAAGTATQQTAQDIAQRLQARAGETAAAATRAQRETAPQTIQQLRTLQRTTVPNASGESAASAEALSRVASEKAAGRLRYRVDTRTGQQTALLGPDAVDATAGPHEVIVQYGIGRPGEQAAATVLDQGSNVTAGTIARLRQRGFLAVPKPLTERDFSQTFLALRKTNEEAAQAAITFDRNVTQRLSRLGPQASSVKLASDPDLVQGILQHATPAESDIITRAITAGQPLSSLPFSSEQLVSIGHDVQQGQGLFGSLIRNPLVLGGLGFGAGMGRGAETAGIAGAVVAARLALKAFDVAIGNRAGLAAFKQLAQLQPGSGEALQLLGALGSEVTGPRRIGPGQ